MKNKKFFPELRIVLLVVLFFATFKFVGQNLQVSVTGNIPANAKWSERMALSIMKRHPEAYQIDDKTEPKWDYVHGLVLTSMEKLYKKTNDKKYYDYIKGYADATIDKEGKIDSYKFETYNIDMVTAGRILFNLYDTTQGFKISNGINTTQKTIAGTTKNTKWWILAQKNISKPNVARWIVYGRTILCPIYSNL